MTIMVLNDSGQFESSKREPRQKLTIMWPVQGPWDQSGALRVSPQKVPGGELAGRTREVGEAAHS